MTTIQTIKEAEERFENKYGETFSESGLEISKSYITQTLLAVFESELESVPEDMVVPDFVGMTTAHDRSAEKRTIINQERARLRSHLTEVINYLKQK